MTQPAVPCHIFGSHIETGAIEQMNSACALPVAVAGALMPDAHQGYGLPIGGVLAARNAVIPYGVGMDIACRMSLSVLDLPLSMLARKDKKLVRALETETSFGVGAVFTGRKSHPVMDDDWGFCQLIRELKDDAWSQLGTSGSGNHFVEFGRLTVNEARAGIAPGKYVALLSHSGSRGPGARIATWYSQLAAELHPELPRQLRHLAWLDLDSEPGAEYWQCMTLMGRYAAANHQLIHDSIAAHLGTERIWRVENHHNFAWQERHGGEAVVVHRKGATPAEAGMLGVIPGSMTAPGFVVEGLGAPESL
ncbi:MAG: RtcB family protein, partial [Deltaproteobacteria bacterium]|nr:RtcB family protein [Deltaproteobacteria bacterium]